MRKCVFKLCLIVVPMVSCFAQAQRQPATPSSTSEDSLRGFLQDYVRGNDSDVDKTTRYFHTFVDLNGDGKDEAIVYLTGREWCGSGGCFTLILTREGASWRFVSKITITRPPIRVLASSSHGWHSISVSVMGGGIQPGYEAELAFDGKSYPRNPSTPPARPLAGKVEGKVAIPASQGGTLLYP